MKKLTAILLCLAAVLPLAACGAAPSLPGPKTVGTDIKIEDITDFYYTVDSSTDPPDFQRYRFYAEDGAYWFYHETRAGDHWPLTEADITVSGALELSPDQWAAFFDCLTGGTVRNRQESADSGGRGPWLYLYWTGDRGTCQEFSFASRDAEAAFEDLCLALKNAA